MNNRKKPGHAGARIKADRQRVQPRKFKAGRVAASRNTPYLSGKIGRELNDLFYQLLMTALRQEINTKTRKQFNASFMLFEDNLYQHDKYIQNFKQFASLKSFADDFVHKFDRDLVGNKDLKNLIMNYAGIHFGMARIAHQLHQDSLKHDVVAESVFIQEALAVIQAYVARQYKKDFSAMGIANIFNKLVANNIAYQTKMTELDERFKQVSEKFNQAIMPVYASAQLDLKLKAKLVEGAYAGKEIQNRRKKSILVKIEEAPLAALEPKQHIMNAQPIEAPVMLDMSMAEKLGFDRVDLISQPAVINLTSAPKQKITPDGVAVDCGSAQHTSTPVVTSRSARLFSTPFASLLGAVAGFVAGIVLAPVTGFSSLLLSISMMVILAGALGSLGYLGANEIDKLVTETRRLEINAGIASTSAISKKLDLKVEYGLIAVRGRVDKTKDVVVEAGKSVTSLKFFDAASSTESLSASRKQTPMTFQL